MTGLRLVRDGEALPSDWTPDAIGHAQDLALAVDEHTKLERNGNVIWLDGRLRQALIDQTPWHREFYGCVRGTLTGVNVTRDNRAPVKPLGGGRVVHVGFPTALAEQMRDALLHEVQIDGIVRQNDERRTYFVTAEVVHLTDAELPSWADLFGSIVLLGSGALPRASVAREGPLS